MVWQYSPYTIPLFISAFLSLGLAIFGWRFRRTETKAFLMLMMCASWWSFFDAISLSGGDVQTQVFWNKIEYFGIVFIPFIWLALGIQYAGWGKWLTRKNLILLSVIPILTLGLVWTNEYHRLIWYTIHPNWQGNFLFLDLTFGYGFWCYVAYAYLLLSIGTFLIIQTLLRSPGIYRGQTTALLIGALIPWISNVLFLSGWELFHPIDLTPVAFSVSGIALAWGFFQYNLMDIIPIARDTVLEFMTDSVFVLDSQERIVDLNPSALYTINRPIKELMGKPINQIISSWEELKKRESGTSGDTEIIIGDKMAPRFCDVHISTLHSGKGKVAGYIVVIRDISQRKQMESAMKQTQDELKIQVRNRTHQLEKQLAEQKSIEEKLARSQKRYQKLSHQLLSLQDEERERLSRNLHDSLGQYFATLILHTGLLKKSVLSKTPEAEKEFIEIDVLLREAIDECRRLSFELSPPALKKLGLVEALKDLVEKFSKNTSVELVFEQFLNGKRLPEDYELAFYRILQESLNNIHKHASATKVEIRLFEENGNVQMTIQDNGIGFNPEELEKTDLLKQYHGLGLISMQERVNNLNGEFKINSQRGKGTRITIILPRKRK